MASEASGGVWSGVGEEALPKLPGFQRFQRVPERFIPDDFLSLPAKSGRIKETGEEDGGVKDGFSGA